MAIGSVTTRVAPVILLVIALAGIAAFSQGLRLIDTVGLLASGALAGASLAAIARRRTRR